MCACGGVYICVGMCASVYVGGGMCVHLCVHACMWGTCVHVCGVRKMQLGARQGEADGENTTGSDNTDTEGA